jgi:hypothetical protein
VPKILCTFEGGCMAFWPPSHSIFPFNLTCFLLCVAHQVGLPPSFSFWFDWLNLWPISKSSKDPPFLLRPCWGMYCFRQHRLRWFCVYCEKHGVSCFSWASFCPFATFLSLFSLVNLHCVVCWWHPHLGQCCHYRAHPNWFGFISCFISHGGYNSGGSGKRRTLPQLASEIL